MGKRHEQTFHKVKQAHEKIYISHYGNANKTHNEIALHTYQSG